jgi:glycosyltransferase involved in cell wall biosynthesis
MGLILGYHYHIPVMQNSDAIYTIGHYGKFVDNLAAHCEALVCFFHSPLKGDTAIFDYPLRSKNIEWVDIGPHVPVYKRVLLANTFTRPLKKHIVSLDAMLIRGPSPLLPAYARASKRLPTAFLIGGDYTKGLNGIKQSAWRKSSIAAWANWDKRQLIHFCKNNLVFVNSPDLYKEFHAITSHLVQIRTTTLGAVDFNKRIDTCQNEPYQLLYSGRITASKGIYDIINAVQQLISSDIQVNLNLVGLVNEGENIDDFLGYARSLGVGDYVKYHGYQTAGSQLFEYYKKSDIFIIASKEHEGFPRTIWEAMAHSLPVVATSVGGIPGLVGNAAEIVSPNAPDEIKDAVIRLIRDSKLRRHHLTEGFNLARGSTLEESGKTIIQQINFWKNNLELGADAIVPG